MASARRGPQLHPSLASIFSLSTPTVQSFGHDYLRIVGVSNLMRLLISMCRNENCFVPEIVGTTLWRNVISDFALERTTRNLGILGRFCAQKQLLLKLTVVRGLAGFGGFRTRDARGKPGAQGLPPPPHPSKQSQWISSAAATPPPGARPQSAPRRRRSAPIPSPFRCSLASWVQVRARPEPPSQVLPDANRAQHQPRSEWRVTRPLLPAPPRQDHDAASHPDK